MPPLESAKWEKEKGRREGGRKDQREERGHGVRGELGCTRAASLSMPSRERPAEGFVCVCWSCVHLERWRVFGSLAGLIKVNPR